jgi:hypothetical protein
MTQWIYTAGNSWNEQRSKTALVPLHAANSEVDPCLPEHRKITSCRLSLRCSLRRNDFVSMQPERAAIERCIAKASKT